MRAPAVINVHPGGWRCKGQATKTLTALWTELHTSALTCSSGSHQRMPSAASYFCMTGDSCHTNESPVMQVA